MDFDRIDSQIRIGILDPGVTEIDPFAIDLIIPYLGADSSRIPSIMEAILDHIHGKLKFFTVGNGFVNHLNSQGYLGNVDADIFRFACDNMVSRSRTIPDIIGAGLPRSVIISVALIRRDLIHIAITIFQQHSVSVGDPLDIVLHSCFRFPRIDQCLLILLTIIFQICPGSGMFCDLCHWQGDRQVAAYIGNVIISRDIRISFLYHSIGGRDCAVILKSRVSMRIRIRGQFHRCEDLTVCKPVTGYHIL